MIHIPLNFSKQIKAQLKCDANVIFTFVLFWSKNLIAFAHEQYSLLFMLNLTSFNNSHLHQPSAKSTSIHQSFHQMIPSILCLLPSFPLVSKAAARRKSVRRLATGVRDLLLLINWGNFGFSSNRVVMRVMRVWNGTMWNSIKKI